MTWVSDNNNRSNIDTYLLHVLTKVLQQDSTLACAFDNTCLFTTFGESWVAGCCPTTSTNCAIATTWYVLVLLLRIYYSYSRTALRPRTYIQHRHLMIPFT